ncbi:restriction endonuclease subunit S [Pseudanabaena sp. 'Roaring Creek']|uniref:restriction endonuclease subunit S n=1 Tax=Pseudanabaena sp. 'Roaring Creek' TaxID=1681830 RepID=UPI0006D85E0B|nr:restriction endonuclease subunit S [Pseudanabaena sp. 'Roaring Creek']
MAKGTNKEVVHCGFVIRFRLTQKDASPVFLSYLLRSEYYRKVIIGISSGSAIINVSQDSLASLKINLPPLLTQKKIASILSAYDDLIENNTRRIKILEEMAQMLYREWFVNFRFPNHENVKMVESELGLIPEGWEVKKLGDLVSFETGKLNSNAAIENGIYPFFTCSKEPLRTDTYSFDTECILLAGNNANGNFHINYFNGKFDVYQRTYIIRTLDKNRASNYYFYFAIKEQLQHLKSISIGAATKFLTMGILNNIAITLSSQDLQRKFSGCIDSLFSQIQVLQSKNANLRKTRDLLLPKLISGEIDVEKLDIETIEIAA